MAKQTIAEKAELLASDSAAALGLVIWNVEFVKEGTGYFLRYYIDKDGGVSIDDCEAFSRMIDPLLDEEDFIDKSYYLEVSSPGIERALVKPEHFDAYIGQPIKVRFIRPLDGQKEITGKLISFSDGTIMLQTDTAALSVRQSETAWVKACFDDADNIF